MEDLSQQINNILSDPNSMQQIQSVISSLGLGDTGQQKQQAPAQQGHQTERISGEGRALS